MDIYSLVTNTKTAELIFNLSIQIIAISLMGWIIMKLWRPRSAPARSAGYLAILASLAILPVMSTMFNINRITWFQPTIELPQSYTRQSSPDNFQERQKILEEKIIIDNEKPEIRQDTFEKNETFDMAPVFDTANQKREAASVDEQQENLRPSDKNNSPFLTRDLIILSANIFGGIWIAGFIIFILRLGFKLSFLKGYMYNLNTGDTERLKNIYNSIKHVFKDKPMPDIYFSSSLSSPVTIGIIRPVMILPVEMENMSDDELKSILLHELAHIFHRDNFIGFLQHVLSSIFWWNPIVYCLNSAYSDSREDVCDNYAINVLKSPKKYANTLLSLAEKTHFLSHMPATSGMSLSRRSFEHRVLDLLKTDRDLGTIYKPSLIILSLILAIVITSCGTGMKLSFKDAESPGNREYSEFSKKPVWVIGNHIIQKLHAGEFKDIEEYIDHLVKEKPYTTSGTRVLEKLYPFVAKRLESRDMLDKWCAEEKPHHASYLFRGNYYIVQAIKHRGRGLGYTVTEEGSQKFRENLELAEKDLEKAYDMYPEDPNSAASMINVCLWISGSEEEKESWFKKAIEADPVSYSAYANKQNYLRPKWGGTKEKDRTFAEQCFVKAPPKSIIHEIMLDYVIENYYWGKKNKSDYFNDPSIIKTIDEAAQKTLKIFPDSISIRSKLAEIETRKGNYGKAIELYSEILTIDPRNPEALQKRGNLYSGTLRKYDLAEADIKMSIESDPFGPDNYEELAKIARILGDYRKAIEYFNIAINRKPKDPQLYIDRGAIKRSPLHEYDSALEDFKQAVKLDSNHVTGNFYMALCYESMQQLEEAEKYRIKTLSLIEARSPGKARSLPAAFANDIKNKLIAMQRRLEQGSSRRQTTQGTFYPKEINYTIDPSPGEGWEKISAEPFNDMAFNLPSKLTTIYVGRIPVPDGNGLHPAEIFRGWIDGMQKKYDYKNFKIESSGTTTIDGRKSYYAVYEYNFRDIIKREKDYIIQGNSVFYRIRYNSHINTYNENLQTFERYVTSFKIAANQIPMRNINNLPIQNRKIIHVLPGEILSQYTGTYKLNPDTNIIISLLNNRLISQLTGQGVVALLNESNMKFVNSKSNTGVEFFKDESGNITHLILTQDGVEKKAVRTSDKVTDGNTVTLTADTLSQYAGVYKMSSRDLNITMENNYLFAQFPGMMKKALFPESETLFFDNIIDTRLKFIKDASGKVSHLLFIQNNVAITAPRINDKKVSITEESQKEIGEDLGSVTGRSTDGGLKGGTLKVIVDMPHFSGLNAGSNAVDENNVNRAVSDLLVLDNTGKKSITLHMNGKDTFFEGGTVLTVYLNVWKGEQSNEDYKYNGRKTVTIDGNTTITFKEVSIPNNYGLTEDTAIKTGGGPKGERDYLDLLCGPNGEKIKYKRLGSCCAFETPNSAFNNTGLLDIYEVTYEGLSEPVKVYLNMYDPPNGEFFAPPGFRMISNFIKNRQIILDNDRSFYFNREFKYTAKKGDKLTVLRSQPCLSNPNQECWCLRHEVYGVGCTGAMPYLLESNAE